MTIEMYCIKERATGNVIPDTYASRGGTQVEPVKPDTSTKATTPRLFHSHSAARKFLDQWVQGAVFRNTGKGEYFKREARTRDIDAMSIQPVKVTL